MPLRSAKQIRDWLLPWAIAPLAILTLVFVRATPPLELWAPMIVTALVVFLLAGIVTALCWALALAALTVPPASVRSLVLATLAGASPTLVFGLSFGSPNFSVLAFAGLGALAAWRVAPWPPARHGAPAAAPTT